MSDAFKLPVGINPVSRITELEEKIIDNYLTGKEFERVKTASKTLQVSMPSMVVTANDPKDQVLVERPKFTSEGLKLEDRFRYIAKVLNDATVDMTNKEVTAQYIIHMTESDKLTNQSLMNVLVFMGFVRKTETSKKCYQYRALCTIPVRAP